MRRRHRGDPKMGSLHEREEMFRVYLLDDGTYWQGAYHVGPSRRVAYVPGKKPREETVIASMLVKEGINVYDWDEVQKMVKKLKAKVGK